MLTLLHQGIQHRTMQYFHQILAFFTAQVESAPNTNHGLVINVIGVFGSVSDLYVAALGNYTMNAGKYDLMHKAADCCFGEIHPILIPATEILVDAIK